MRKLSKLRTPKCRDFRVKNKKQLISFLFLLIFSNEAFSAFVIKKRLEQSFECSIGGSILILNINLN